MFAIACSFASRLRLWLLASPSVPITSVRSTSAFSVLFILRWAHAAESYSVGLFVCPGPCRASRVASRLCQNSMINEPTCSNHVAYAHVQTRTPINIPTGQGLVELQ